jgi:hypothetical protein
MNELDAFPYYHWHNVCYRQAGRPSELIPASSKYLLNHRSSKEKPKISPYTHTYTHHITHYTHTYTHHITHYTHTYSYTHHTTPHHITHYTHTYTHHITHYTHTYSYTHHTTPHHTLHTYILIHTPHHTHSPGLVCLSLSLSHTHTHTHSTAHFTGLSFSFAIFYSKGLIVGHYDGI